jgi:hypothetical protein
MARIAPELATMTPIEWSNKVNAIIKHLQVHNDLPYALPIGQRIATSVGCVACCWPCCAWSTFWRLVACPFQCACRGAEYIVSDNNCTFASDKCLTAAIDAISALVILPTLDVKDVKTLSTEERRALQDALTSILEFFQDADKVYAYAAFMKASPAEKKAQHEKRQAQNRFIDNCMRPVYEFAGGHAAFGPFMYVIPNSVPQIVRAALNKTKI